VHDCDGNPTGSSATRAAFASTAAAATLTTSERVALPAVASLGHAALTRSTLAAVSRGLGDDFTVLDTHRGIEQEETDA
jgi:hypothetical protein